VAKRAKASKARSTPARADTSPGASSVGTEGKIRPSYMVETNGGGRLENVAGFNAVRARSEGFRRGRVPHALRNPRLGVAGDLEFAKPQFTFGQDDRVLIQDTSVIPWRCVCQLMIEGLHGPDVCGTGWMAGPRTVITAGHNLFSRATGHRATKVWVMPARSGDAVPFGYDSSEAFEVHPDWASDGDRSADVGVVWLRTPIGERLGWFGIGVYSDAQLRDLIVNNAGYPNDKIPDTQWFNAGRIVKTNPKTITYGLDTEPGQSGSPIFRFDVADQRIVVAVHAYGDNADNFGVRITDAMFETMSGWIK
jgi:glutamyl endopeptidase